MEITYVRNFLKHVQLSNFYQFFKRLNLILQESQQINMELEQYKNLQKCQQQRIRCLKLRTQTQPCRNNRTNFKCSIQCQMKQSKGYFKMQSCFHKFHYNILSTLKQNSNGNHVIYKCLTSLNQEDKQFLYNETMSKLLQISINKYGKTKEQINLHRMLHDIKVFRLRKSRIIASVVPSNLAKFAHFDLRLIWEFCGI